MRMVECEEPVVPGNGEEAGGGEALVQGVGERIANPVQVGLSGTVVERKDEYDAACGFSSRSALG